MVEKKAPLERAAFLKLVMGSPITNLDTKSSKELLQRRALFMTALREKKLWPLDDTGKFIM